MSYVIHSSELMIKALHFQNRKFLHDVPEPKFHELSDLLRYYSRNKLPTCDAKLSQPLMELYSDYSES